MSDQYYKYADDAISAFMRDHHDDLSANWLGIAPTDWGASVPDWRVQSADVIGRFEALIGLYLTGISLDQRDTFRAKTLLKFRNFLANQAEAESGGAMPKANTMPTMAQPRQHLPMCAQPLRGPAPLPADLAPGRAFSIRRAETKWQNGTVLHYAFLTAADWDWPEPQKQVVRNAFSTWKSLGIGLKFKEVQDPTEAEILIGRQQDNRSWSFVGTEILKWRDAGRTMNFGWDLTTQWGHATALHEIGHTLGLEHEHQNSLSGIVWNEQAVYDHFLRSDGWDQQTTYNNVIAKLSPNSIEGSNWDPTSIMHYPFDPGLLKLPHPYDVKGVDENVDLSVPDQAWVRHWYPAQTGAEIAIAPLSMHPLPTAPGSQADFVFEPAATGKYTVNTVGPADSRIVVFEDRDGEPRYLAAADDAGTDANASVTTQFVSGRRYYIRVRVAHADADRPIGLALH